MERDFTYVDDIVERLYLELLKKIRPRELKTQTHIVVQYWQHKNSVKLTRLL